MGLSYGAASGVFHRAEPVLAGSVPDAQARLLAWALAAAACGVLKSAVNKILVMTAVKGADPAATLHDLGEVWRWVEPRCLDASPNPGSR